MALGSLQPLSEPGVTLLSLVDEETEASTVTEGSQKQRRDGSPALPPSTLLIFLGLCVHTPMQAGKDPDAPHYQGTQFSLEIGLSVHPVLSVCSSGLRERGEKEPRQPRSHAKWIKEGMVWKERQGLAQAQWEHPQRQIWEIWSLCNQQSANLSCFSWKTTDSLIAGTR